MRVLLVASMAAGLAVLTACSSDCNQACQDCRAAAEAQQSLCEPGCAGDSFCLDQCEAQYCLADDACDGELGDDGC